jgi:hypothetical protein
MQSMETDGVRRGHQGTPQHPVTEELPTLKAFDRHSHKARQYTCMQTRDGSVALFLGLAASHLLGFQVLVQEVERLLVGTGATSDGEHALASIIVRSLGNGDAGTRRFADLADLAATATDDAANHI